MKKAFKEVFRRILLFHNNYIPKTYHNMLSDISINNWKKCYILANVQRYRTNLVGGQSCNHYGLAIELSGRKSDGESLGKSEKKTKCATISKHTILVILNFKKVTCCNYFNIGRPYFIHVVRNSICCVMQSIDCSTFFK
uniref:SCP domain-containing protein n=1 Tax=Heterorhabditis bacteriophora TaxID=37862 RepID=A0A1I7X848_HETBA